MAELHLVRFGLRAPNRCAAGRCPHDDVAYRLLTILQILGSLVLAAGVADLFEGGRVLGVVGYLIMRLALVVQWVRASRADVQRRRTCRRYAMGVSAVQVLWVGYLFVPESVPGPLLFLVLVACELAVPVWAEAPSQTPWHPHHIAERYGLFFIIVLGETILSTTVAISAALDVEGSHLQVVAVVAGGILVVFSTWWLYFSRDSGLMLSRAQGSGSGVEYLWGFGHYFVFASAAAIGAGLAARVAYRLEPDDHSRLQTATAVTVPVAVLLASLWFVCLRDREDRRRAAGPYGVAVAGVLAATFGPLPEVAAGIVCAVLLAVQLRITRPVETGH